MTNGTWAVTAGAVLLAVINGWFLLRKTRVDQHPADTTAMSGAWRQVTDGLRQEIARQAADLDGMRHELIDCHRGHAECVRRAEAQEDEIAELRGKVTALEARINRPPDSRTRRDDR